MARKKQIQETKEQMRQRKLNLALDGFDYLPEPTYKFNVGDTVKIGSLENVVIVDILYDDKIYEVDYTKVDNNYGNPIIKEHERGFWNWLAIRPLLDRGNHNIIKNQDLILTYYQTGMGTLFGKKYNFGLDMNPEYQRDYVWEISDKVALIDSLFNNIDIGKFVFVKLKWKEHPLNYSYEILDGKQRIEAICGYYENRFNYNGLFFNDLSFREQHHFENYMISIAEVSNVTREQKLRFFLKVNTQGRVMSQEHLDKIEEMLNKIKG